MPEKKSISWGITEEVILFLNVSTSTTTTTTKNLTNKPKISAREKRTLEKEK